jgi:subtilase family serine protease
MASAMCPNCNLLLVEGSTASFANLAAAANRAATCTPTGQAPVAISNSYGGGESGTTSFAASYIHAGITVTASTGDSGFAGGPQFPATAATTAGTVLAVGGTSVHVGATPRETVWSGGGSGCSTVYGKPAFQNTTAINALCANRMEADVAAVGDPNTGVAVFAPTSATASAFQVFGGTSVSAPLIAGIVGSTGAGVSTATVYSRQAANAALLFDVTSGSNGSCTPTGRCTARTGYDGPTGLGTPVGSGAF